MQDFLVVHQRAWSGNSYQLLGTRNVRLLSYDDRKDLRPETEGVERQRPKFDRRRSSLCDCC